jgi:hypothetical protein
MHDQRLFAALIALATTSACTTASEPRTPAPVATEATPATTDQPQRHTLQAPVVVSVDGPAQVAPGKDVAIKVIIERTVKGTPLDLAITLPPGAELAAGQMREHIMDQADRIERTLVLRVTGDVPLGDVKVAVDASDAATFGAHATAAYRFGRAAPTLAQPVRMGRPITINGKRLGNPIPLGPAK